MKKPLTTNKYTAPELYLIVCAASYELHDTSFITDFHYDLEAKGLVKGLKKKIPSFMTDTGQWVHDIMTDQIKSLVQECLEFFSSHNHNTLGYGTFLEITGRTN